jgi:hypothetical protein
VYNIERLGSRVVRTVEEYRHNAEECRKLAQQLSKPDDRKALEMMASAWDRLAAQREHDLQPDDE